MWKLLVGLAKGGKTQLSNAVTRSVVNCIIHNALHISTYAPGTLICTIETINQTRQNLRILALNFPNRSLANRKFYQHAAIMGGLRTYLRAPALICALAAPVSAQADADIPDDPLHFFATCAGRMSALMEHQWLVDGPASDITKARRSLVLDVLASLTPPGDEVQVMSWRVEAKAAHAALLGATRHGPATDRTRAAKQAATLLQQCEAYLS